jgi:hypothetical protein
LEYAATQVPGSQGYVRAMHAADEANREVVPGPSRTYHRYPGGGR